MPPLTRFASAVRRRLYRLPLVCALILTGYFLIISQPHHVATILIAGAMGTLAFAPGRRHP
jgi:hypothetical protein